MKRSLAATLFLVLLLSGPPEGTAVAQQAPGKGGKDAKWKQQEYETHLAALDSKDSIERARAIESLRRLGEGKAVKPLLALGVSERYAHIVSLAGETAAFLDPAEALIQLRELLEGEKSKKSLVSRNLVILLAELEQKKAGELILDRFSDTQNKAVFLEVVRAVGHRRLEKGAGLVKRALAARDLEIKNVGAIAAGYLGTKEFVPILMGALENTDGEHCKFAAWALNRSSDETVFDQLQGRLGSASGVSGEAKAKVLEGSARSEDVDRLVALLTSSTSREYREAAAIALGRLGARGKKAQEILLSRMLRDPDRKVRGACWHALSRVATKEVIGPSVQKRLRQRDSEMAKYVFHLAGDMGLQDASGALLKVMINERDFLLRQSASINFWKVASSSVVKKFEQKMESASGQFLELGIEALGFRRNPEGFRFLLRLLKVLRDGSKEEYLAEKALERITGHFFGPHPGIWKKWFEKNPEFFTAKQGELERNKWRKDFDKENKGFRQTEETEYTVQLGLEYLARHQHPDGRLDPQRFQEQCESEDPCRGQQASRIQMDPTGTTALAVLTFLGAGYSPDEGKYRRVISRALDYLLAREQANGNYKTNDLIGGYHRPLGAQAFAEAYLITGREEFAWAAQRSLDFLTTIQNRLGAWRYRVRIETTDTSCMSWNLFALKTGQKADLDVREIALAGCYHVMDIYSDTVTDQREDFIDIDPAYGYEVGRDTTYEFQTGYQNAVWDTKYATVPLGIMCRIFLGWRRSHPFCIGSANKILNDMMEQIPRQEKWELYRSFREYPTYAWYYGTLAMHQMGGRYFRLWNERIQQVIPNTQTRSGCSRGSWPMWNHDSIFGRLYTAEMGVLALETYYRYLPVLQD